MIQQRPLRVTRLAVVELDEGAADLHSRHPRRPGRSGLETELLVGLGGLLRRARPQRDVVEVLRPPHGRITSRYFLRSTARWSCCLFIPERPLIFIRLASL